MTPNPASAPNKPFPTHVLAAVIACAVVPMNVGVYACLLSAKASDNAPFGTFTVLALLQLVAGVTAVIMAIVRRKTARGSAIAAGIFGGLAAVGAPLGWLGAVATLAIGSGGAWGRPLRIRGRQLHPNLKEGADWTEGERPDPSKLDEATRAALEALWLHDAQKEHASVPAFSRVSWLLAAVGAPAELLAWAHRAGLEEIDHTRRCFALAAGYAGRSFTVEAMPELLVGGLDVRGDPLVTLAVESLSDGCQLEDFNADVAARCAEVCEEPVTKSVLQQIAREERTHAEFSWAVLEWVMGRDAERVRGAVEKALAELDRYARPTAVSGEKAALVARADVAALRRHGRISDFEWAQAWTQRLEQTRSRARTLLLGQKVAEGRLRGGRTAVANAAGSISFGPSPVASRHPLPEERVH